VIAGIAKIARPAPAQAAARAAGVRVSRRGIVVFGLLEVGSGIAGGLLGGRAALAVAACYVVLAVVAIALLIRAPATPCACLGASNAVVTRTHVAINVGAAGFAAVAATGGSPLIELSDSWVSGVVIAVLVGCCVQLAVLALETLPEVTAAIQEGSPST
jgi:hypothetical protein